MNSDIVVEREGPLAIWTLNRADRRNALSRQLVREIGRLARECAVDPTLRAVIVTGAGGHFCAGADLKERQGMSEDDVRDLLSLYRVCFGALDRMPVPCVAAIDGVALGGGLELALACDFRVASSQAILGLPETALGIIPGAGGTQRLPREIGAARAREMILLARRLDAAEALSWGLVSRVGEGTALETARTFVAPLLSGAPIALAAALEAVSAAADSTLEEGLAIEREAYERTLVSADRLEALRAFAEKRQPVFQGQ
jgi:methylglutaconyl-CoA hydratase